MKKEWNACLVKGSATHVLKEKFKLLRNNLGWWNKRVFGGIDLKIDEEVNTLNDIEVDMERGYGKTSVV